jgi:hypothetical protein
LKLILDAARKNKTVKEVRLVGTYRGMSLSVPAALSLASVVSEHPEIQEIEFYKVTFVEFGPIALAIQQNRNLTSLLFLSCRFTPNLVECICWLLTENALESMTLDDNIYNEGELSFDISGTLLGNSSLKELVIHDTRRAFGSEIFQAIPHMIRRNKGFETIYLILSDTITDYSEAVRRIAQAAEGHASLKKLAIVYHFGNSYDESSAGALINHAGTAEAIGTMLHNAPALRELHCRVAS